ncbi:MAG: hypothetical protein OXU20_40045 [Myxococcales bacterium]|nr:hypothetical protein [Myxococcales bacterium]
MNNRLKSLFVTSLLAAGLLQVSAQSASAASGVVSGVLMFYQNQGNFCPLGRDCSGAKYTWLDYQRPQPFRKARIYVRRASDNAILGQGMTDAAGFFSITWSDPSVGIFTPVDASLDYLGEHADGRFIIAGPNPTPGVNPPLPAGAPIVPLQSPFTALPGFTWLNFPTYGSAAANSFIAMLHDGAYRMWADSLSQSFRMRTLFWGLEIQAFDNSLCTTSCAVGDSNVVVIDSTTSAMSPQARVMHEMGHIASYLANTNWTLYDATRTVLALDYSANGFGWNLASPENESAGWEEAVATHYADIALYFPWADVPYSCLNTGACPDAASIINVPLEPSPNCALPGSNLVVGNHMQYHWDNYDSEIDYVGEIISEPMFDVVNVVSTYSSGSGNGAGIARIDEFWNAARTAGDDVHGRSTQDFHNRWLALGTVSSLNLAANCGSGGD